MSADELPLMAPPPPGAGPIEPRRRSRSPILVGCVGAAIALLALLLILIVSLFVWLRSPGTLVDGGRLADADTVLYAEFNVRPDDASVRAFLAKALEQSALRSARDGGGAPNPLELAFGGSTPEKITRSLPVAIIVTRRESPPGTVAPAVMTISAPNVGKRMGLAFRVMSLFLRWSGKGQVGAHGATTVVRFGEEGARGGGPGNEPGWAAMMGTTFLFSKSREDLEHAIDLIDAEDRAGPPEGILAERPDDALMFVSAKGGYAESVARLLETGTPEFASTLHPMLEDAGPVTITGRLESSDLLSGTIRVAAGSPGEEEQDEYAGKVTAVLPSGELTLSLTAIPRRAGERHAWEMRVEGLETVALRSLDLLDLEEGRRESLPSVTVEPERKRGE